MPSLLCYPSSDILEQRCKQFCKRPVRKYLAQAVEVDCTPDTRMLLDVYWSDFQLSVESNFVVALVLHCHAFDWLYQPIRSKTKTNRDLPARIFPRLAPASCLCLKF